MSRPNWQVFLARELAARAGNTDRDHAVGALIVRGLVARNPQIDVAMQSFPQTDQTTQEQWTGADKPTVLTDALMKLWNSLDVPSDDPLLVASVKTVSDKRISRALWQRAAVEYLSLPKQEHEAVAEIATRSKALGWFGASAIKDAAGEITEGYAWEGSNRDDVWSGFRELRGASFAGLRDDILSADTGNEASRTEILRVYDKLVSDPSYLRTGIRAWQTDAASLGYYTGAIDGLWGPKSETAFLILRPEAYNRSTTLADLITVESLGSGKEVGDRRLFTFNAVLASGVARDKWIATRPSNYPPAPADDNWGAGMLEGEDSEGEVTRFEVTLPDRGETISTTTVTITPVDNPEAEPIRVQITLPDGNGGENVVITPIEEGVDDQRPAWPGVLAVVGGLGLLGLVVAVGSRKPQSA